MSDDAIPGLSRVECEILAALFDVVIPTDDFAGGWEGGVRTLLQEQATGFMAWSIAPLRRAATLVEERAQGEFGAAFSSLSRDDRDRVFAAQERAEGTGGPLLTGRDQAELTPMAAVLTVAFEGYYGGTTEPARWAVARFSPVPEGVDPVDPEPLTGIHPSRLAPHYDVVIIGAGAGGGAAAAELAEGGRRVLLVERSSPHRNSDLRGNHLQGKRMAQYDVTAGPGAGSPRVLENPDGSTLLLSGDGSGGDYGLIAMTLGGGTRVWQGMSWRFYPEDFRMASEYGTPEGSTLADWPFGYDELEPYYERAEWELGVSGDGAGVLGERTPRRRPYPMPALPDDATRLRLTDSAEDMGWRTTSIPFAINSIPRSGRSACVRCSQCVGHACPVDAKNGTQNTFIPRAIASGNTDLLTRTQAVAVEHDGSGVARSVRLVTETADGPIETVVDADTVVVSAGALETPRLLLASGLGNEWVGRNHHSHGVSIAVAGTAPKGIKSDIGPGHSVATLDFVHRGHEAWGGGVLFDLLPTYPLARALAAAEAPGTRYGRAHKNVMRDAVIPLGAMSMVQEIPHSATKISLDPVVRDRYGMPVVRARGVAHRATVEAVDYMSARAAEWVQASGGRDIRTVSIAVSPQGTEHSAGTARMGTDPAAAACDETGRLFGTRNVYVADASLHPTNGGFNPALTVIANALRVARLILDR